MDLSVRVFLNFINICINQKNNYVQTIKDKLASGEYNNPWEFCDDMYLMFDNAWLYNRRYSRVYKCCDTVSEELL